MPPVRMLMHGERSAFTAEGKIIAERMHRIEHTRGYDARGSLWSPGYYRVDLSPGKDAALVVSTENWDTVSALVPRDALIAERQRRQRLLAQAHPAAQHGLAAELVLAADQFLIKPAGRVEDAARAAAAGDEARTVIAGYHWFTDWGRDTMISLEGLTLCDRAICRSGLHPADICQAHSRRADPESVSRRRERGALSHGRCDAVVFSRTRTLCGGDGRPGNAATSCCRS